MITLHRIAMALPPGMAIHVSQETLYVAASENLTSRFDHVRPEDIKDLYRIVHANWNGFSLREDPVKGGATLYHLNTCQQIVDDSETGGTRFCSRPANESGLCTQHEQRYQRKRRPNPRHVRSSQPVRSKTDEPRHEENR